MALRLKTDDTYMVIKQQAEAKWKNYHSDCYYDDKEYFLTYADGKSAQFMPGTAEFFNLSKYREDIGTDFKRVTFYLCTLDYHMHHNTQVKNTVSQ